MKYLLMILVLSTMALVNYNEIKAQGETAVPFLLLAPDSRASGMGETGGGLADNASAIFWNPAGIAFLSGSEIDITHSKWLPQFNLPDLFYDYLTYRKYIDAIGGSLTASITYMNFGEFIRTLSNSPTPVGTFKSFDAAFTIGYATKIDPSWGLGFNFRIIHSKLSDKPTEDEKGRGVATSVSFDIATMWRPQKLSLPFIGDFSDRFSVGVNISNIGPKIAYIDQAQADPIPTNFRLGFALRLFQNDFNSLTYTLDFSKLLIDRSHRNDTTGTYIKKPFYESIFTSWVDQPFKSELREFITSMGIEYWYGQPGDFRFAIRSGFFYEDPSYGNRKFITLGAGFRWNNYGFDFSYLTASVFKGGENQPLSDTMRFTLSIDWGNQIVQAKGFPSGI
jgi:hypothetical protein